MKGAKMKNMVAEVPKKRGAPVKNGPNPVSRQLVITEELDQASDCLMEMRGYLRKADAMRELMRTGAQALGLLPAPK
jgi:hypothetical protein